MSWQEFSALLAPTAAMTFMSKPNSAMSTIRAGVLPML